MTWIAVYNPDQETKSEIHLFESFDLMWAWLDGVAVGFLADGDFHDDDEKWASMTGLGRETQDVDKVCAGINGFLRAVYQSKTEHLQVVER